VFADAGIEKPPATRDEPIAAGKKLSGHGKWGIAGPTAGAVR